jgi:hypothetical protein
MVSDKTQVLTKSQQGAGQPSSAKDSEVERNPDDLLDVFTTEDLVETTVSKLSKDLNDLSIYSLLEETKQVAQGMRGRHS